MLYGLKQAGKQWKIKLNKILIKLGFVKSIANNYLHFLQENEEITLMILVYVNNIAVAYS